MRRIVRADICLAAITWTQASTDLARSGAGRTVRQGAGVRRKDRERFAGCRIAVGCGEERLAAYDDGLFT